jgi:hypothetical protein
VWDASIEEALDCVADAVVVAAKDKTLYVRDGVNQLQAHLRKIPQYAAVLVTRYGLIVDGSNAEIASEAQWAFLQEL